MCDRVLIVVFVEESEGRVTYDRNRNAQVGKYEAATCLPQARFEFFVVRKDGTWELR